LVWKGALSILTASLVLAVAAPIFAVTCEECQEMEKKKDAGQQELAQKDKEISVAFEKKQFQKVTQIRSDITALRRKLLQMRSQDEDCKKACLPEAVKDLECKKLEAELLKLDSEDSTADTEKIDALYRDLSRCKREMEQLKKAAN
jgi:hypothetical protein